MAGHLHGRKAYVRLRHATAFRSSFVTTLAWFFIVLAAFSAFAGILQNVLMQEMFLPSMYQPMRIAHHIDPDLHTLTTASYALAVWFFRSFMLICLVTLAAAIGLLLRKEWARKVLSAR